MFKLFKPKEKEQEPKVTKVTLLYDDGIHWRWNCPNDNCKGGSFTYSKRINHQWGVPDNKVYCAVCNTLYDFEKEHIK